jgi:hypothetical protein
MTTQKNQSIPGAGKLRLLILLLIYIVFLLTIPAALQAEPLVSPTWKFQLDLPEGYEYAGGDGKDRFSFATEDGAVLDLVVYPGGTYASVEALAEDIQKRLNNRGDTDSFEYREKQAVIIELVFSAPNRRGNFNGWGLCVELDNGEGPAPGALPPRAAPPGALAQGGLPPLLVALAYGPEDMAAIQYLSLSALDSIAPTPADARSPGIMTEFAFPRDKPQRVKLANTQAEALIDKIDAEAAQYIADREFKVLSYSAGTPRWKEAWVRFYRMIYRDAYDRLADAAFALERSWNQSGSGAANTEHPAQLPAETAAKALAWVQSFTYERDFMGSDFVNPVSAALEGRGDCDSRALLWAIILEQANIEAAIMVSREYSHAMGLADIPGPGARFELDRKQWLVAETTSAVALGRIAAGNSDPSKWIGVNFH